jgi:hypothetical protein
VSGPPGGWPCAWCKRTLDTSPECLLQAPGRFSASPPTSAHVDCKACGWLNSVPLLFARIPEPAGETAGVDADED